MCLYMSDTQACVYVHMCKNSIVNGPRKQTCLPGNVYLYLTKSGSKRKKKKVFAFLYT